MRMVRSLAVTSHDFNNNNDNNDNDDNNDNNNSSSSSTTTTTTTTTTFNSHNFELRVSNPVSKYIWLCIKP